MTDFPLDTYPDPLREYISEASASLDCDPAYIAVPLLAVLASAIGNTRRIRLKKGWTEPAVVWAAIVGESGTVKSPAMELATRPVWRRQRAIIRSHQQAMVEYQNEARNWKAKAKADRGDPPESPPPMEHPLCSDITIEALADRLCATPRGTLVALDELAGWFGSFNQYKSGGADISHWLSLHGARALKVDRKTGDRTTIYVPHAAACVTGTIQPDTLRRALLPEFFDNGLAARLLLAMPPARAKQWSESEISEQSAQAVDRLFASLYDLRPAAGVDGDDEPQLIDLTDGAREVWIDFVNAHNDELQSLTGPGRAAWAKLEGYAARFALIFSCVRRATGEIDTDCIDPVDIEGGIALARWFGAETLRVYHAMSETVAQRNHWELLELIHRLGGRVTPRQLKEHSRKYGTSEAAEMTLEALVDSADGWWDIVPTGQRGRPATVFVLADSPDFPARSVPVNQNSNGKSHLPERGTPRDGNEMGVL